MTRKAINDNFREATAPTKFKGWANAMFAAEASAFPHLNRFAQKVVEKNFVYMRDFSRVTEDELYKLVPTSEGNKERMRQLFEMLGISFKAPKPDFIKLVAK